MKLEELLQGWDDNTKEVFEAKISLSEREIRFIKRIFEREVERAEEDGSNNSDWNKEALELLSAFKELDNVIIEEQKTKV